jgi:hypothetical protein
MVRLGRVGGKRHRGEDRAQKDPVADIAAQKVGVLALPSQPAAAASGFSITGAVSTKTLISWGAIVGKSPLDAAIRVRVEATARRASAASSRDRGSRGCGA